MFDLLILLGGAIGSLLIWPLSGAIGFVIAFVVVHFFLFCNVFRISRRLELGWAAVFIALVCSTMAHGQPPWPVTVGLSLVMTLLVIGIEMKKPSYHGIWWRRVNPNLRAWWDSSIKGDNGREALIGND